MLATAFLDNPAFTHLFMVDSDMVFAGDVCRRLLAHDKPMIGAPYMTRSPNGQNTWLASFQDAPFSNGIAPCEVIGLGALLAHRSAIEAMAKRATLQESPLGEKFYNLFGMRAEDAATGRHSSDDYAFCRRWRMDCGGEIWALVDAKITHLGEAGYGGDVTLLDHLKASGAFTPAG